MHHWIAYYIIKLYEMSLNITKQQTPLEIIQPHEHLRMWVYFGPALEPLVYCIWIAQHHPSPPAGSQISHPPLLWARAPPHLCRCLNPGSGECSWTGIHPGYCLCNLSADGKKPTQHNRNTIYYSDVCIYIYISLNIYICVCVFI